MATLKVIITVRKRWYFPELFALAHFYVILGLVSADDAATYVVKHGIRFSIERGRG